MNDPEKFIRCLNAIHTNNNLNDCGGNNWICKECPYCISWRIFIRYVSEKRQYALQTTEQRIFSRVSEIAIQNQLPYHSSSLLYSEKS